MKSCTDITQSKVLAEILPLESADMLYWAGEYITHPYMEGQHKDEQIPIWSFAALLSLLPKIGAEEPMVRKLYYTNEPKERYICEYGLTNMTSECDNPIDACYQMILKLHESNMLWL